MACFELSRQLEQLEFSVPEAAPLARTLLRVVGRVIIDAGGLGADPEVWPNTAEMAVEWIDQAVRPLGQRLEPGPGNQDPESQPTMAVGAAPLLDEGLAGRLRRTALLLEARGFALPPERLGALCLGGAVSADAVRAACAAGAGLGTAHGLVVVEGTRLAPEAVRLRAERHRQEAERYQREAERFARALVRWLPFVRSVALAGSLASGGFVETDDVDLNLVVAPGRRHLAYVAVNLLGVVHALRHRGKPVDDSSARPVAPRVMTVNLVLEADAGRLARDDEQMALELLLSRPLAGAAAARALVLANPRLLVHFPQLADAPVDVDDTGPPRLPGWLFPRWLDLPARALGEAAWRWLMWTRRNRPGALARVAYVRQTMRPYTLFDRA